MTVAYWFLPSGDDDAEGREAAARLRLVRDGAPADVASHPLADRIRAGDHAAFTEFVQEHYERAVRVAWAVVGSREAAQDVVQDVFVRLWEQRETLDAGRVSSAYVLASVHHRALNDVKRGRVRDRYSDQTISSAREEMDTAMGDDVLIAIDVEAALAGLPDRWRRALELRFLAQLAVPEVASALGISANAAHQLLYRAVRELRRRLGDYPGSPAA